MNMLETRQTGVVIGTTVDITSHKLACERVFRLAELRQPAYVCFATAHMLVEAIRKADIGLAYRSASIVNPDGAPIAWCLKIMGYGDACCVNGPTNTPFLLREAERHGVSVGFYGGRPETLVKMQKMLEIDYPLLKIAYIYSPPFRDLSKEEQANNLAEINASGAQLLFVGLGSPKQELWMFRNYLLLNCVCLGVGAVFEFLSGEKVLPPKWVQSLGLTWLVRLCQEPRRLAIRNLYSPIFTLMFIGQCGSAVCRRLVASSLRKFSDEWRNAQ